MSTNNERTLGSLNRARLRDGALGLGYHEVAVFPVQSGGKVPLIGGWRQSATHVLDQIESWWSTWPEANIGIATDGLVVVDVDDTSSTWLTPARQAALDSARVIVRSPRGGWHYYFDQPRDVAVRSSGGVLAPGIDIRADGGFIVAPPSIGASGNRYEFVDGRGLAGFSQLAVVPEVILSEIQKSEKPRRPAPTTLGTAGGLVGLRRNAALGGVAGGLKGIGLSPDDIRQLLGQVNCACCQPPLSDADVDAIAQSMGR
jgi:hypothetical protein